MSTRRNKRRRIDTDLDSMASEQPHFSPLRKQLAPEDDLDDPDSVSPEEVPAEDFDTEAFPKEREIWDAFREEHYELLEQLPLSLHRAFTLIQELDQQAQEHFSNLTPAILKYVSLRRSLADAPHKQGQGASPENINPPGTTSEAENRTASHSPMPNGTPANGKANSIPPQATNSNKGRTPPLSSRPLSVVTESSDSTRELLTSMAQSVEEISRASVEKQYLAQHVYDLVDRYIRDLDRSIKEQEASISLGLRPGTHPASIMLPELVVPQFKRTRTALSPPPLELDLPEDSLRIEIAIEPLSESPASPPQVEEPPPSSPQLPEEPEAEEVDIIDITEPTETVAEPTAEPIERASTRGRRKGRKRRKGTKKKPEQTAEPEEGAPQEEPVALEAEEEMATEPQPTLTLKIPAQVLVPAPVLEIVDPNEPRYCFCNQVSYGDMIGCDNPTCPREWFHMGCIGLVRPPKGKWYCRECAEFLKKPKGKKRAR
ncbi:hypothetical protein LXA43DRAFT_890391 [Ganoderma leucocontextum]|nr:hypothetical protein LXA43DRAFT_890391 [Ganoderma leucocontextum]